ncbi:MAG TPA: hypothetical protein O0X97_03135 [Methanocorpusculum sp.]|nr:hypothetical protein [Methanocorpusculum sp.]
MDEFAKHEARNYLTAAGFFILAVCALLFIPTHFEPSLFTETFAFVNAVIGISLIIIGILLAAIGSRGFTAVTFLLTGMFVLVLFFAPGISAVTGICLIIFALILLTAGDRKKYLIFLIPLFLGILPIVQTIFFSTAGIACDIILAVLSLWYAFASVSERAKIPGGKLLKSDDETDFKRSGSVLGYLLFALTCGAWTAYYFLSEAVIPLAAVQALSAVASILLVLTGILLFAAAKMRFTPILFILTGVLISLSLYVSGVLIMIIGAMFIVLGIFAFLREESRLLPGLMFIIYGLTAFVSVLITGNFAFGTLQAILNLIPGLIALYLAVAVFAEKKLPLF